MLGLPKSTEMSQPLPKKMIYSKFNMNAATKDKFDADISRIAIVSEISPATTTIAAGENIAGIFCLLVSLKHKQYEEATLIQLTKLIPQNLVLILECGTEHRLAIYHTQLIQSNWMPADTCTLTLKGLNFDDVWNNIVIQIGSIVVEDENSLDEQIALNEKRNQIEKDIARLDTLARKEKQPKKKFELVQEIHLLRKELYNEKGYTLMLSYIIFLFITFAANLLFKWNGLDRIAIAATIAGCFFALADLINWYVSYMSNYYCSLQIINNILTDTCRLELNSTKEQIEEFQQIIKNGTPYKNKNENLDFLISYAEEMLQINYTYQKEHEADIVDNDNRNQEIIKQQKQIEEHKKAEACLMVIGFVVFFMIVVFDALVIFLTPYQTWATIIAFIFIMLNYYLKDVIETNTKQELDAMTGKANNIKEKANNGKLQFQKMQLAKRVDIIIALMADQVNNNAFEEEEKNGQTENAQPEQG